MKIQSSFRCDGARIGEQVDDFDEFSRFQDLILNKEGIKLKITAVYLAKISQLKKEKRRSHTGRRLAALHSVGPAFVRTIYTMAKKS